ncbi:hypothetical protein BOTNAR_0006g00180 [Botryotinia narcissicola]|uniref:BZIP domain-containing protein n=1 Tax=Botryotinia narcissicola TaxID=278944 RepID=A0A4Z1JEK7_9HELO|nr:hypothetical protein BOTNAR_0006g00180 [Botryotinia narcissicola]
MNDMRDPRLRRQHQNRESQRRHRPIRERKKKSNAARLRSFGADLEIPAIEPTTDTTWQYQTDINSSFSTTQPTLYHRENDIAHTDLSQTRPNSLYSLSLVEQSAEPCLLQNSNTSGPFGNLRPGYSPHQESLFSRSDVQSDQGLSLTTGFLSDFGQIPANNLGRMAFSLELHIPYHIPTDRPVSQQFQYEVRRNERPHAHGTISRTQFASLLSPVTPHSERVVHPWNSRSNNLDKGKHEVSQRLSNRARPNPHRGTLPHRPEANKRVQVWPRAKEMVEEIANLYEFGVRLGLFDQYAELKEALATKHNSVAVDSNEDGYSDNNSYYDSETEDAVD